MAKALVASRWSQPGDLVVAFESIARQALLAAAEKDGSLDNVEDELFRFGRVLNREPELATLLADTNTPADKRVELLDRLGLGLPARPRMPRQVRRECQPAVQYYDRG